LGKLLAVIALRLNAGIGMHLKREWGWNYLVKKKWKKVEIFF